jgi:opacity protein-like surface antigen
MIDDGRECIMKALLIGASVLALGATSAVAQQQPAPTLPPADAQATVGASPGSGVFSTPDITTAQATTQPPMTTPAPTTAPGTAQQFEATRATQTGGFSVGGLYGYGFNDQEHRGGLNLIYDFGLNPGVSFELEQAIFWTFGDGVGGRSVGGINFNFGEGLDFLPYIGANIGGYYGNGIENSFLAGPEIGLKIGFFEAKVAYDMPLEKAWDDGNIFTTIGLGIRF